MIRFAAIAIPFIAAVSPLAASAQDNLLAAYLAEEPQVAAAPAPTVTAAENASKSYRYPATLELSAVAPRDMSDHPAVIVARRARAERDTAMAAAGVRVGTAKAAFVANR